MTNLGFVGGVTKANKRRRMKKILLWILLVVQICLIFCFWCMQTSYPERTVNDTTGPIISKHHVATMEKMKALPSTHKGALALMQGRVNFVTKRKQTPTQGLQNKDLRTFENVNKFTKDFVELKTYRLMNITGIEAEITQDYGLDVESSIWCFTQGTFNDSNGYQIYWNTDTQQVQCMCLKYWHGKDCAQNEVIYRALILPRNQFALRDPIKAKSAHMLVYMLEGYFSSLDFLELQIKSMTDVVDHFLIFWRSNQHQPHQQLQQRTNVSKALRRKLNELLQPVRYTLYQCVSVSLDDCSRTEALFYFNKQMKIKFVEELQSTDLLLHTNENIVLSSAVLRYFKYYAPAHLTPWRFRLKYNVYGFFWQHPKKTYLDGFLSSFGHLDEPDRLSKLLSSNKSDGFRIIGDLNHISGWYCQYCAHPDEILELLNQLQAPDTILPTVFEMDLRRKQEQEHGDFIQLPPKNSRNGLVIDSKYLEYLIAQGLHTDGKTRLEKVRINSDSYYAPAYAEKLKWKFGNLLTNLFEAIENDYVLEEAEGGFGF